MGRLLLAAACVALAPLSAPAWSKAGHMVTGSIAYAVLKQDNPAALARVVAVLKAHPQYEKLWRKQVETLRQATPAADPDEYLVMLAARWADDIRGDKEYDRPAWHFINYPYKPDKPAGQPEAVRTKPPDPAANIVKAFALNQAAIKAGPEDVDRAVPLCWLAHLVGDVQMPLHAASLFSERFPDGDRGGTRFWVRVTPPGQPINLHYFWDGLITNSERYADARNVATELRLRPEFARDKLTELADPAFENWAKVEGVELARTAVYRDGKLAGGATEMAAVTLPADYPQVVKPIAERRAVLAGYRLAAVLAAAFGE